MTTPRQQRLAGSFGWQTSRHRSAPHDLAERLLRGIGADPAFTDDVLGDLTQERARRRDDGGAFAASVWYLAEIVRAVPHLAWNAVRHGGERGRARVFAIVAAIALAPVAVLMVVNAHFAAPTRLVVEGQRGIDLADGLIINSRRPIRLVTHAFDARGRPLGTNVVRYERIGDAPLDVKPDGVITCLGEGDASLRATAGAAMTIFAIRCRPVSSLRTFLWVDMVPGDSAVEGPFEAIAPDRSPVSLLAGERFIVDTTVARRVGDLIRPVAPGTTTFVVRMGDAEARTAINVYAPVPSLAGLRPDQRMVIAPLHLARGASQRWPLPVGLFTMKYHRRLPTDPTPTIAVSGPVMCLPGFAPTVRVASCLVRGPGAAVRITNAGPASVIDGQVSLARRLVN